MPTDFARKRPVGPAIKPNPSAIRKVAAAPRPSVLKAIPSPLQLRRELARSDSAASRHSSSSPRSHSSTPTTDGKHTINGSTSHNKRPASSGLNPAFSRSDKARLDGHSRKRGSPAVQVLTSDTDDGDSDGSLDFDAPQKRARTNESLEPDAQRAVKSFKSFSDDAHGTFDMVHAADITLVDGKGKYEPSFPNLVDGEETQKAEDLEITLQYPGANQRERYICQGSKRTTRILTFPQVHARVPA